jgi:type IX secretion system PorP/SprF family membrane protein
MKNRAILLALLSFGLLTTNAQQLPLYSNYFFTPFVYNPAMSGASGVTEATLVHRRMWANVQGSPETSALTLNGALNKKKIGYSIYAFNDRTDILSRFGVYGSYAYHLQLSDKNYLSFGLAAGYLNNTIDLSRVNVDNQIDPVLFVTPNSRGVFDLNFGMNLRIDKLQLGLAIPQIIGSPIQYTQNYNGEVFYQLIRHYIGTAQYDLEISGDRMVLSPFIMVRSAQNVPFQFDLGAMFNMKKFGFAGLTYRSEYAVTANVGIHLNSELSIGYAHDFSINTYGSQLGASREFMLTYRFGDNAKNERLENEIKKIKDNNRKQDDKYKEMIDERLEEFRDEIKSEVERLKAAEQAAGQNGENNGGQQGGNNGGQQGGNNGGQQGGNNGGQQGGNNGGQQGGNNGGQQGGNNGGQQGGNNGGQANYTAENQVSNVQPGQRGYYVVAGVYSSEANAVRMVTNLTGQGMQARFFRDSNNGFYYVYLLRFDAYGQASQAKNSGLNNSYTGELWIKIIE